eukprot:6190666-Pleurochrysis_carterae.AAC.1
MVPPSAHIKRHAQYSKLVKTMSRRNRSTGCVLACDSKDAPASVMSGLHRAFSRFDMLCAAMSKRSSCPGYRL